MILCRSWYPYDQGFEKQKLFQTITTAKNNGFSAFEIAFVNSLLKEYEKELLFFKNSGLQYTVHADSLDTNIASKNVNIQQESINQLKKTIEFAGKINAIAVIFHPGSWYNEETKQEAVMRLKKILPGLLDLAKQNSVELAIENMDSKQRLCTTKEEIKEILTEFPHLKMCFDLAHALYVYPQSTEILKFWNICKEQVIEIHLSGIKKNVPHYNVNLKESTVSLDFFQSILQEFKGIVKIENVSEEDIEISKNYLQKRF